jgi:hypothetical protein
MPVTHGVAGSSPVQTAQTPRKLNVFGVLFFCGVVRGVEAMFLALKYVTDPSVLVIDNPENTLLDELHRHFV